MKKRLIRSLYTYFLLFFWTLAPIDNPHFYRATLWWGEPRICRPWLTTVQADLITARARHSYDEQGKKAPLFNFAGPLNLQELGKNVANLNRENPLDQLIIHAAEESATDNNNATIEFNGHFRLLETPLQCYQNFDHGFFLQGHIPIRRIIVNQIKVDPSTHNTATGSTQLLLEQIDQVLELHDINIKKDDITGCGDFSLLVGWAHTNHTPIRLDFIDVSAKIGLLFPTAQAQSATKPLTFPLGYNGHFGVPLKFDLSAGYLEWLLAGIHIGALFLIEKTRIIPLTTSAGQTGLISLTTGPASVDPGTYWDFGGYIKADHFCKGISVGMGYLYTQKDSDVIEYEDNKICQPLGSFLRWNMHELQFFFEYDPNNSPTEYKPIISLYYNYLLSGKRILKAHAKGAGGSVNFCWYF